MAELVLVFLLLKDHLWEPDGELSIGVCKHCLREDLGGREGEIEVLRANGGGRICLRPHSIERA